MGNEIETTCYIKPDKDLLLQIVDSLKIENHQKKIHDPTVNIFNNRKYVVSEDKIS